MTSKQPDPQTTENDAPRTKRLRLAPDDVPLLWGIVDGFMARNVDKERWPRLERIRFDLEVMMAEQERANAD